MVRKSDQRVTTTIFKSGKAKENAKKTEPKISHGQATKSTRGMPWHRKPKKDVTNCEKLRGAVSRRYIRRYPNGAIRICEAYASYTEYIGV